MDGNTIYERAPGFELSETPDGYVLYHDGDEQVHFLNTTASVILELCDGQRSVDEITRLVEAGFEQDRQIAVEIEACLSRLEASKVVFEKA